MNFKYIENEISRIKGVAQYPSIEKLSFLGPISGGDKIRTEVSQLQMSDISHHLCDVGDSTSNGFLEIGSVLEELQDAGGPTITCLSSKNAGCINKEFLMSFNHPVIVTNRPSAAYNDLNCIGMQRHFFPEDFQFDVHKHIRLGALRKNIEQSEVLLRNADFVWIDLGVLRYGDNIGCNMSSTAGLLIEELCKIAKYAGASQSLSSVIISGFDENKDTHGMVAKNVALLIYYILKGFQIRKTENARAEELQRYTVLPDHVSSELVFIEDKRSGRWWVELYSDAAEKDVKLACTKEDYENACNNHISERITSLITLV